MVIAFASSSSVEWVDETVAANAAGAAASESLSSNDDDVLSNRRLPMALGFFFSELHTLGQHSAVPARYVHCKIDNHNALLQRNA